MVYYAKLQSRTQEWDVAYLEVHGTLAGLTMIAKKQEYELKLYTGEEQIAKWRKEAEQVEKDLTARLKIKPEQARADFARK